MEVSKMIFHKVETKGFPQSQRGLATSLRITNDSLGKKRGSADTGSYMPLQLKERKLTRIAARYLNRGKHD